MPRLVLVAFLIAVTTSKGAVAQEELKPEGPSCPGLPVSHFESRFPEKIKRLTFDDTMLETFVELWKAGARPDLPKRPERVVIYALPGLPLIIGYQEQRCMIAYLAIDSKVLWRWLRQHLGWNV